MSHRATSGSDTITSGNLPYICNFSGFPGIDCSYHLVNLPADDIINPKGLVASRTVGRVAVYVAEQAVLAVVSAEAAKRGDCRLALDHIAAVAGVSRWTVRNALRQAQTLGLVTIRERRVSRFQSQTNVVAIVDARRVAWMRLARREDAPGSGRNSVRGRNPRSNQKASAAFLW